jgi:exodeoxyribonuclease-3
MRIASWNVNGLRSCLGKGFENWLKEDEIAIACLQEVKTPQAVLEGITIEGYTPYWHAAEKPGYSGTAILVKNGIKVLNVTYGLGLPDIDREGRVMAVETDSFILVNIYAPHSQRELARLPFKLDFCTRLDTYLESLKKHAKPVLITGDLNVAHQAIDLANPKSNVKNAGFLPEERAWMDRICAAGFADCFRMFTPEGGHYTWWSQRIGVREKNVGWRIDYFLADQAMAKNIKHCGHWPQRRGSDHCPIYVDVT